MRTSNKPQLYIVTNLSENTIPTRLIRGTLREVESKLRGEVDIRPATAEEAHSMADVEIETATGEPT